MNNIIKYNLTLVFVVTSSFLSYSKEGKAVYLKTEYLTNPIGIDVISPRLSWEIDDNGKHAKQFAYQILISNDSLLLSKNKGILWDSKKVVTNKTNENKSGINCKPNTRYYWKVAYWDGNNKKKSYSDIVFWETGMGENWKGSWITDEYNKDYLPAPVFRKEISLSGKVSKAVAYICGLGYYELFINGKKVGNNTLDPGFTRFDTKALYVTHEVSNLLTNNINTIGVVLGNGWFNIQSHATWDFHKAEWRGRPTFILNILVEYESGEREWIVSDESWKVSTGAISFNNLYSGEFYDARKEIKNWNQTGFNDEKWKNAKEISSPTKNIIAQSFPPIRIKETVNPIEFKMLGPNRCIFNLGRNIAGVCRLKCKGQKGTKIRMRHAEKLYEDGTLDMSNIDYFFSPQHVAEDFQTDIYILKGEGVEEYTPRFTYHGFQYVEVLADRPIEMDIQSIEGLVVHTDLTPVGSFSCSNDLLNKIYNATKNSYISNLHSIPTDCPTREKNGWTADAHVAMDFGLFNFDGITFYEKWIRDFYDVQKESGEIPDIVPTGGWGYPGGNPAWDMALFVMPYKIMMFYGDSTICKESYPYQKKYMTYVGNKAKNNLLNFRLWDWSYYKTNTPVEFTSSVCYYMMARLTAVSARINNDEAESKVYSDLAQNIKNEINKKYYRPEDFTYANGSQTALAYALYGGIVPSGEEKKVASVLAQIIRENDYFLDFGLFGSQSVLNVLSTYGFHDVSYKIASKKELPSWGWWIDKKGATTLWETWKEDGSASLNHVFLGEISAWMIKTLAGINYIDECPGFKKIKISPKLDDDLQFVKASYHAVNGKITSEWRRSNKEVIYHIVIPANTSAIVELSKQADNMIKINGQKKYSDDILTETKHTYIINLSPGEYTISTN